jgi:hypothetical protein
MIIPPIQKAPAQNESRDRHKKLDNLELLEWASHRIELCQKEQFFGKLTLHFEAGKIVRTTSEKSEVPS